MTRALRRRHLVAWSVLTPLMIGVFVAASIASRSRGRALEPTTTPAATGTAATSSLPVESSRAGDHP